MRRLVAFFVFAIACCLANAPALAGKRVALVIGNSAYQNVAQLANPAHVPLPSPTSSPKRISMW